MLNKTTQQLPNMGDEQAPSEVTSIYSMNHSNCIQIQTPPAIVQPLLIPTQIPLDPIQRIKKKNSRSVTPDVVQVPALVNSIENIQNYNKASNSIVISHVQNGGLIQKSPNTPNYNLFHSGYQQDIQNLGSLNQQFVVGINAPNNVKSSNNQNSPRQQQAIGITPVVDRRAISTNLVNQTENNQQRNITPIQSSNVYAPFHNSQQQLQNSNINNTMNYTQENNQQQIQTVGQMTPVQTNFQPPFFATALTLSGQHNDRNFTPPSKISFSKQQSTGTTDLHKSNEYRSNSLNQARSQLLNIKISQYGKIMNAKDEKDIPQNPLKKISQKPLLNKTSSGYLDSQVSGQQSNISPISNILPPMLPTAPTSIKNSQITRINNHQFQAIQSSQIQPLSFQIQSSQSVSPLRQNNKSFEKERVESPEKLYTTIKPYISLTKPAEYKPVQKVIINIPPNHPMNHQYQINQQNLNQTITEFPSIVSLQNFQDQQAIQMLQNNSQKNNQFPSSNPSGNTFTTQFNQNYPSNLKNYNNQVNRQPQIISTSPLAAQANQQINYYPQNSTPQTLLTSTIQKVPSLNSFYCFQSSNQLNDNAPVESKYNQSEQDDTNSSKINAVVKPSLTTKKEKIEQLLHSNDSPLASHLSILQTPEKKTDSQKNNKNQEQQQNQQEDNINQQNNTSLIKNTNNSYTDVISKTNISPNKQENNSSTSEYKNAQIQLRNTVDQLKSIIKQPILTTNTLNNQLAEESISKENQGADLVSYKKEVFQKRLLTINTQIEEIKKKNEDSTKNIGITINDLLRNEAMIEKQLSEYKDHQTQVGQKLLELDERIQMQVDNNNQYLYESKKPLEQQNNIQNEFYQNQDQHEQLNNQNDIIEEEEQNQSDNEAVKKSQKYFDKRAWSPQKREDQTNSNLLLNSNSFGEPLTIKETNSFLEKSQPQLNFAQNKQNRESSDSNAFTSQNIYGGIHNLPETSSYVLNSGQIKNNLLTGSQLDQLKKKESNIVEQLLGSQSQSQNEQQDMKQSTHQNANSINLNAILRKQNSSSSNSPVKVNERTSPLRKIKNDLRKSISEMQGKNSSSPLHKIKQNSLKNQFDNDVSNSEANQRSSLVIFKTDINSTSQLYSSEHIEYQKNDQSYNQNESQVSKQANIGSINNNNANLNELYPIPESQKHKQNELKLSSTLSQTKQNKTNSNSNLTKNNNVPPVISSRESIVKQFQALSQIQNKQHSPISKITKVDHDKSINYDKSFNQDKSMTTEKIPKPNKNINISPINESNINSSSHLKRPNNSTYSNQEKQNKPFTPIKKQTTVKKDIKVETDLEKIKQVINKSQQKGNQSLQEKGTFSTKYAENHTKNQNIQIEDHILQNQKQFQTSAKSNTPKFSETKTFSLQVQQEFPSNQTQKSGNYVNQEDDSLIIPVNLNEQLQNQESNQKSTKKHPSQEMKGQQKQSNSIDYNGITFNGQQLLEKIQSHLGINISNKSNNQSLVKLEDNQQQQQLFNRVSDNNLEEEIQYDNEENQLQERFNDGHDQQENIIDEYKSNSYLNQPQAQNNYSNSYVQQDLVSQSQVHNQAQDIQGIEAEQDEMNLIAALNDLNQRLQAKSTMSQSKLLQNNSQKFLSKTPERAVTEAYDESNWQSSYSQNKTTQKQPKDKLNKSLSQEKSKNISNSQSPMKGSYIKNQQHQQQMQQNLQKSMAVELKKSNKITQSPNQKIVQQELKRIFDDYSHNSKNENKKTLQEMQQLLYKSVKQQSSENTQSPAKQPQYIQKNPNTIQHMKNNSLVLKQVNSSEEQHNKQLSQTEFNTGNIILDESQQPKQKKTYSGMHFKKQVYSIVKDVDDQNSSQNLQISHQQKKISQELKDSSSNNLDNLMKERSFEFWAEKIKNSDNPKQILDVWKMINTVNKTKQ